MQIEAQEVYPNVTERRTGGVVPTTIQGRGFGYPWQRWLICLLLFLATSINYMNRSVLGILAHTLDLELRWSENDYGNVVVAFWISGALIRRGIRAISTRKWILAGAAALALLLVLGTHLYTSRSVVILFSVLTAAHQAWAANLFTVNSDLIPRSSLSTSVGIAGAAGALGGVLFQKFTGLVLMHTRGDYSVIFFLAAFAYPVSLFIFHLLTRRTGIEPAEPSIA